MTMKSVVNSGQFKKGQVPWINGKRGVIKNPLKGKKMPEEWKAKLRKPKSVTHPLSTEHRRKISERQKGEKSKFWKGGITAYNAILRQSMEYKLWRQAVFTRDSFTCIDCKAAGGQLQAHHIKPFSTHPELNTSIENGVTLCFSCHRKTDSYGGRQTYKNLRERLKTETK